MRGPPVTVGKAGGCTMRVGRGFWQGRRTRAWVMSSEEVDLLDLGVDGEAMAGGGLGDWLAFFEQDRAAIFLGKDDEAVY
jgi:hypothetical protein